MQGCRAQSAVEVEQHGVAWCARQACRQALYCPPCLCLQQCHWLGGVGSVLDFPFFHIDLNTYTESNIAPSHTCYSNVSDTDTGKRKEWWSCVSLNTEHTEKIAVGLKCKACEEELLLQANLAWLPLPWRAKGIPSMVTTVISGLWECGHWRDMKGTDMCRSLF